MTMGRKRGNREGTIYQRGDGLWTGQITVAYDPITRKAKRKTVYGATRGEVADKLKEIKPEPEGGHITVKQAVDLWLAGHKSQVATSSLKRYTEQLGPVMNYLGGEPVATLTGLRLTRWMADMERDGLSAGRRRDALKGLRQVLRRCVAFELLASNP